MPNYNCSAYIVIGDIDVPAGERTAQELTKKGW